MPPFCEHAIAISWPYWKPETTSPGFTSEAFAKETHTFFVGGTCEQERSDGEGGQKGRTSKR